MPEDPEDPDDGATPALLFTAGFTTLLLVVVGVVIGRPLTYTGVVYALLVGALFTLAFGVVVGVVTFGAEGTVETVLPPTVTVEGVDAFVVVVVVLGVVVVFG